MGELTETLIPLPPPPGFLPPTAAMKTNHHPRPMLVREDCWSEDATFTLIEAWGQHYLDLNRGNLRQKHWQEVADAVNASHGHTDQGKKGPRFRTDVQCKNRIDTLKKKYKVEKSRVLESRGSYTSPWSFFTPLDSLLAGSPSSVKKLSSPIPSPFPSQSPPLTSDMQLMGVGPPMAVPLLPYKRMSGTLPTASPAVVPQKRPSPVMPTPLGVDYSNFRRNYSAVAAAAAAETDEDEEDELEEEEDVKGEECLGMDEEVKQTRVMGEAEGIRNLARAIERFGEVYSRVESEKQRQIVELEKQKMQLAKEMELQRMQMLVDLQVQLQKVKRAKRSNSNDTYR